MNRQRERSGTPVGKPSDLAEFLGDMGLGEYAQALTNNEIDLEAVQLMADSDFQDIGACGVVCRMRSMSSNLFCPPSPGILVFLCGY